MYVCHALVRAASRNRGHFITGVIKNAVSKQDVEMSVEITLEALLSNYIKRWTLIVTGEI